MPGIQILKGLQRFKPIYLFPQFPSSSAILVIFIYLYLGLVPQF